MEKSTASQILQDVWAPLVKQQLNDQTALLNKIDPSAATRKRPNRVVRKVRFLRRRIAEAWDVLLHGTDNIGGW